MITQQREGTGVLEKTAMQGDTLCIKMTDLVEKLQLQITTWRNIPSVWAFELNGLNELWIILAICRRSHLNLLVEVELSTMTEENVHLAQKIQVDQISTRLRSMQSWGLSGWKKLVSLGQKNLGAGWPAQGTFN